MKMKKAIVFDLDGTLIDSIPDVHASLNRALAELELGQLTLPQVKTMIGHGGRYLIECALKAVDVEPDDRVVEQLLLKYLELYKRYPVDHTIVYPNVVETIEQLRDDGYSLGICTNKPFAMTNLVLERLSLLPLFSGVTGGDNLPFCKPDPRHIEATLELMQQPLSNAIMVGDSKTDIQAANNAEIPSVLVTYGYHLQEGLSANVVIDDFSQLPNAIETINSEVSVNG